MTSNSQLQSRPKTSQSDESFGQLLPAFFVLVVVLSIPFWLLSAVTGLDLLPGLPIAALMTFCPMLAAMIVVYRENRTAGVIVLLQRALDFRRIKSKIWYMPALLLMPVITVVSFGVLRLTGSSVPVPQIAVVPSLLLCIFFFIAALGEELGWSGFAIDPMQNRWGALRASLILGLFWAVYHYIALAEEHRSLVWIIWWSVGTVAARVIIVWVYNNTGKSVFAAVLFHMMINVTWQLFPINGSYFDPGVSGIISVVVVAMIIIIWEPKTLARYRNA